MSRNRNLIRAFVAVDVSDEVRASAESLIRDLAASGADVKWVEPHNLHLTLKFLGDVDLTETAAICAAVAQAAEGIEPFDLEIRAAGAFPDIRRPRTVWMGVTDKTGRLGKLFQNIENRLQKLRFSKESRRFQAHLTIGRLRGGGSVEALRELIELSADFDAGPTTVSEVVLYSSQLSSAGPAYDVLGRVKLK